MVCIFLQRYPGKVWEYFLRSFMMGIRYEIDKQVLPGKLYRKIQTVV